MSPTSALSNFISCVPIMENKVVSKLHNSHLKIIGDDYVGKEVVVKISKLNDEATINQNARSISDNDLIMGNIFVTTSPEHVVLSCFKPELIIISDQQHNCTTTPLFLVKTADIKIMTSQGVIEESLLMKFKLESKQKFMQQAHMFNKVPSDSFRFEPPTNITPIHAILEKLSEFSTPQIVGISMGLGTIIITLFCAAGVLSYCCCGDWRYHTKYRGSFTHPPPSPAQPCEELCQAARPPGTSQAGPSDPIHQTVSPLIGSDPVDQRSLELLRSKVKSLAALSKRNSPV